MRGTITPSQPWDVMVDLFFYREPDETKDREDEEGGVAEFVPVEYAAPPLPVSGADTQWEGDTAGQWEPDIASVAMPAVVAAPEWTAQVPAAGWEGAVAPVPAGWEGAAPGWESASVAPGNWDPVPQ